MPKQVSVDIARPSATRSQHALRLLVLLAECGEQVVDSDPVGAVRVIRSELRLQALDFWLRNPDYLADELVTKVEVGDINPRYLDVAQALLDDPEPDLRWYPMPRWRYGAYEALDDAFSLLETYGLALLSRVGGVRKRLRNQFFLTAAGVTAAHELADDEVLSWYSRQVKLVALVAGDALGQHLKDRQYRQAEYASTDLGLDIAPITGRVRLRLANIATIDLTAAQSGADR